MTVPPTGVPDLLRRFAPAPYGAIIGAGDTVLRVETNDPTIISEMQKVEVQQSLRNCGGLLFLKVIRDKDAPCDGGTVTMLSAYPLFTLHVGVGTMIVLDCERQEAMGFLSSEVAAEEFAYRLFPAVCNLLANSISTMARVHTCQ
jgi:hypothetical protein